MNKTDKAVGTTTLTRHDWSNQFDSIKWALETHVGMQDHGEYNFAVLYGNEDCPERIDFYHSSNPGWQDEVQYVWENK